MLLGTDVSLPDSLVTAHRDGKLVVFAGAGVSLASPANYPTFNQLAKRIAVEAGDHFVLDENEPPDRFLGSLEYNGVNVHRSAQDILSDPNSQPTDLHRILVALFPSLSVTYCHDKLRFTFLNSTQRSLWSLASYLEPIRKRPCGGILWYC